MDTPSVFRRLCAMLYDSFIITAILFAGTGLVLSITRAEIPPATAWFQVYLLFLWYFFVVWFWTHGGQTVGMAAWRLRLVSQSNFQSVGGRQATQRWVLAVLFNAFCGLGLLWAFVDREGRTLYDRLSKTQLILLPKRKKASTK